MGRGDCREGGRASQRPGKACRSNPNRKNANRAARPPVCPTLGGSATHGDAALGTALGVGVAEVVDVRTRADVEHGLARLIVESVLPDSWRDAGGTTGSIWYLGGRFVITHTSEGHRQVRRLLDELRQEFIGKDRKPATAPSMPNVSPTR